MVLAVLIIIVAMAVVVVITFLDLEAELDAASVTAGDMFLVILAAWPLITFFMMSSLFLGAFLPRRRFAAMVVTLTLIVSFLGNNLSRVSEPLEAIQPLFPFYYYNGTNILTDGIVIEHVLALLVASLAFFLLALTSFQRRNITTGAWPWQRSHHPGHVREGT